MQYITWKEKTAFYASRREWSGISVPIVLLLLAAFVVLGRWVLAPL